MIYITKPDYFKNLIKEEKINENDEIIMFLSENDSIPAALLIELSSIGAKISYKIISSVNEELIMVGYYIGTSQSPVKSYIGDILFSQDFLSKYNLLTNENNNISKDEPVNKKETVEEPAKKRGRGRPKKVAQSENKMKKDVVSEKTKEVVKNKSNIEQTPHEIVSDENTEITSTAKSPINIDDMISDFQKIFPHKASEFNLSMPDNVFIIRLIKLLSHTELGELKDKLNEQFQDVSESLYNLISANYNDLKNVCNM